MDRNRKNISSAVSDGPAALSFLRHHGCTNDVHLLVESSFLHERKHQSRLRTRGHRTGLAQAVKLTLTREPGSSCSPTRSITKSVSRSAQFLNVASFAKVLETLCRF